MCRGAQLWVPMAHSCRDTEKTIKKESEMMMMVMVMTMTTMTGYLKIKVSSFYFIEGKFICFQSFDIYLLFAVVLAHKSYCAEEERSPRSKQFLYSSL